MIYSLHSVGNIYRTNLETNQNASFIDAEKVAVQEDNKDLKQKLVSHFNTLSSFKQDVIYDNKHDKCGKISLSQCVLSVYELSSQLASILIKRFTRTLRQMQSLHSYKRDSNVLKIK